MNTYPNYRDENRDITLFETNKFLRILFTVMFVTAVFIVPVVTAIHFLASPLLQAQLIFIAIQIAADVSD